jgi:transcription regulator MmyB-like protein
VVAHNRPAELIMPDLLGAPPGRRNLLRWLFTGDGWDRGSPSWEATARANLRDFRTEYARHPGDASFAALVGELTAYPPFGDWWAAHDVQLLEPTHKLIPHPVLGRLHLVQTQARPSHQPALRLRILVPADTHTRTALASPAGG